jgi:uncharacterized protein with ATP-grasp and redox domains
VATRRKQLENLKRGQGVAGLGKANAALKAYREQDARLGELAQKDPYAAYPELHEEIAKQMSQLIRDERRSKERPHRDTTDRLKEFRQLTEALNEYYRTSARDASTGGIFADLEARISQANLGEGPAPYLEHPSRSG